MSGSSKIIKNRIKSVSSAKNITNAMELVAAAKIKRAVNNLLASRTYAKHALELLVNLSKEKSLKHPLLTKSKSQRELLVVIASNRGLCGSYNINVVKLANEYSKKNKNVDFIIVGRKAENVVRGSNGKIIASFIKFPDDLYADDIIPLAKMVMEEFINGNYGRVSVVYTDFISSLRYEAKISTLLPITKDNLSGITGSDKDEFKSKKSEAIILFEPDEEVVLNLVLSRLTEVRIYQSLLEANASEHSARMVAMKNATDNAEAMIDELTLYYNQARQSGITQELAEISGGAEALNNAG